MLNKQIAIAGLLAGCMTGPLSLFAQVLLSNQPRTATQVPAPTATVAPVPGSYLVNGLELENTYKNGLRLELVMTKSSTYGYSSIVDTIDTHPQLGLANGFLKTYQYDYGVDWETQLGVEFIARAKILMLTPYQTISGWSRPQRSVDTLYSSTHAIETATVFDYNPYNSSPRYIGRLDSKGDSIITRITFPIDYPASSSPVWLQNLQQKNYVTLQWRTITLKPNYLIYS
jgi:hypothetical protein